MLLAITLTYALMMLF